MKSPTLLLASLAAPIVFTVSIQRSFAAEVDPNFSSQIHGTVHALNVDASGNILVGGEFQKVNGLARANLARLTPNGTLDPEFSATTDAAVFAISGSSGGAIIIGGAFNSPNRHVARLLPTGEFAPLDVSASSRIDCLATAPDGRTVFGGPFRSVNSTTANYLGRMSASGALDSTFSSGLLPAMSIEAGADAIALQSDGRIIVGGNFCTSNGFATLLRLNVDGSVDETFTGNHGPILYPKAILALSDGKLLVSGIANSSGDGFVRRLNSDGTVDGSYQSLTFDGSVEAIALDPLGGLIIGGTFGGGIGRLHADGAQDTSWDVSTDGAVKAIAIHGNDGVLIGGAFHTVGGRAQSGLARISLQQGIFATKANGAFHARIQGEPGRTYEIQASTDLQSWLPMGTVTAVEAGIVINDARIALNPHRFFRARLVE